MTQKTNDDDNCTVYASTPSPIEYAREQAAQAEPAAAHLEGLSIAEDAFPGYRLLERIHHGGQGVVYKAEQCSTGQTVALKVLRSGHFSDAIERIRFRRELDVLARIKHPNIVSLHDGGRANETQFLVMDYIEGVPLDIHLRSHDLSISTKLTLFVKICRAVAAAHVRGVIHRDLKPANIVVDRNGEPHILDFGLAKLIGEDEDAATMTGQFLGSLHWASPEQARGASDEIDVRTDVHALGVILFYLLTGNLPFDAAASTHRSLQNIIETEPSKPSTMGHGIDSDLDVVTLKCLAKDSNDRYQSVEALAADVERHLCGLPIEARGDSTWYLLTKTARRHRKMAVALLLIIAATLIYAITMTGMYRRATTAERDAAQNARHAQAGFRKSLEAVELLIHEVADQLEQIDGAEEARRLILEKAYEQLEGLLAKNDGDPRVLEDYARTLRGLGDIDQALARYPQAYEQLSESLRIQRQLCELEPNDVDGQARLSIALVRVGDVAKLLGNNDITQAYYRQALAIDEELLRQQPGNAHFMSNLVWSYERNGELAVHARDLPEARHFYLEQLALADQMCSGDAANIEGLKATYAANAHLAQIANKLEDWDQASNHMSESVQAAEMLYQMDPDNVRLRRRLARAYITAADPLARTGSGERALKYGEKALALIQPLTTLDPDRRKNVELELLYHHMMMNISYVLSDAERCERETQETLIWLDRLVQLDPTNVKTQGQLIGTLRMLALGAQRKGDTENGRAWSQRGLAIGRDLVERGTASVGVLQQYARLLFDAHPADLQNRDEAIRMCRLAVDRTNHADPEGLRLLAQFLRRMDDWGAAIEALHQALDCPGIDGSPLAHTMAAELAKAQIHINGQ